MDFHNLKLEIFPRSCDCETNFLHSICLQSSLYSRRDPKGLIQLYSKHSSSLFIPRFAATKCFISIFTTLFDQLKHQQYSIFNLMNNN